MQNRRMANPVLKLYTIQLAIILVSSQNPTLDFEVTEELANSFVGSVPETNHLQSLYDDETIAQLRFEFTPQPNQDASLFTIERSTGTVRTGAAGIDREAQCPFVETCFVYIDVAVVEPITLFQVMTVRISIVDINDDTPQFRESNLKLAFPESAQMSTFRILPLAIDRDSPTFGVVEYHMVPSSDQFELRTPVEGADESLKLFVAGVLDRELQDAYEFQVIAVDGGSPALSSAVTLRIAIDDTNDNAPTFTSNEYAASLSEDQPLNVVFLTVSAADPDVGVNGQVSYALSPNTEAQHGHLFGIHNDNGGLYLKSRLDYETEQQHILDVIARDAGSDSSQVQTKVTVDVMDVNDFVPKVTINALAGTNVMENSDPGAFVAYVSVFDADSGENGRTECTLDHPAFNLQSLPNNAQYTLNTRQAFDRERVSQFALTIQCSDFGSPSLSGTQDITVLVGDENDNAPMFLLNEYTVSLNENNYAGEVITRVQAIDADQDDNGHVTYSIAEGAISSYIAVNEETGDILARQPLDYELVKELTFEVVASDSGQPSRNSTALVTIQLIDTNDEAPHFLDTVYNFQIYENEVDISRVGDVEARDKDSPQWNNFRYSLQVAQEWAVFEVDPTSGVITTTTSLNREQVDYYSFIVIAQDTLDPNLIGSATVSVTVLDKNDNAPVIIYPSANNRSISVSTRVPVGQAVTQILAKDDDILDNGRLRYKFAQGTTTAALDLFEIDPISGAIITKASLENRNRESYVLSVTVQDMGTPVRSAEGDLIIDIDGTIPYAGSSSSEKRNDTEQNNLQAIIAVSAVSAFIVVALILIIVLIKLRDRKKLCQKEKSLMPHYQIEQHKQSTPVSNSSLYDGVCNGQDIFSVETHQNLSEHQIIPTLKEGQQHGDSCPHLLTSDHSILYDKRLDKSPLDRNQFGVFPSGHNPDIDLSSSTDVSTSDSGRGGSVDGEQTARIDNQRHYPDILPARPPNAHDNQAPVAHTQGEHNNRAPPPSYGSFLRQKSQRESKSGPHSPAYSIDSEVHRLSPIPSNTPVIPHKSYRNNHNRHNHNDNMHEQPVRTHNSAPSYTTVHSTSALSDHCRVRGTNAPNSVKSCQADGYAIKQETATRENRAPSPAKRVNFASKESHNRTSATNVAIGKYNLKDVPRNGFSSVMV